MNIFKKIKTWFYKKSQIKPTVSKESEDTLKVTIDHYIAWWKGENPPPLDTGKTIWFISMDEKELERKYGPSKGHLNTNDFIKTSLKNNS